MRKLWFAPIILGIITLIFSTIAYQKSSSLEAQGNLLAKQGKYQEALIYYNEAKDIFPFNPNLSDDIDAVQLLVNSQNEYSKVAEAEYAEVQNIPNLTNIPTYTPSKGEYFVPILMYHHIRVNPKPNDPVWQSLNVRPQDLESELNYLSNNNYHIITLDDLQGVMAGNKDLPQNPVVITFDDGYEDFYQNAFPLLKKYNMKATEFVITQVEIAPAYLSWNQIAELDKSGLVDIEAHSEHHPHLTYLTATSIKNEIEGSKKDIESHLGHSIHWFAYPYGAYNNFVISQTQNAGFLGAVSTNYSPIQSMNKIFVMPRIMVDGKFTLDEFISRIRK